MSQNLLRFFISVGLLAAAHSALATHFHSYWPHVKHPSSAVQLGPRPYFLVNDMEESWLKYKLQSCQNRPVKPSQFSIGHRGAALQFPEHTRESYEAAARMGAGIIECDVTFTKDKELVCRHSQCDLHSTTNILETQLAGKCSEPFSPAEYDTEGNVTKAASARCCTSDITLDEFKSLHGKMDASNPNATTVTDYLGGTAPWRTDLYANHGTLMTHKDSIALFKSLGVNMAPELKSPSIDMPFDGFTRQAYAQKMIGEYKQARVPAQHVWAQSFNYDDVLYWINQEPAFGRQAVFLDDRYETLEGFDFRNPSTYGTSMAEIASNGVNIVAPPMWMLVDVENDEIVPSRYAREAQAANLDMITWTLERSGPLQHGGGWYYQSLNGANSDANNPQPSVINNDGDTYELLDVLAKDVGVLGVFSDWPATVTYYANCMGLK